jgi:DNA-binding NtrC family response regulator
MGVDEGIGPRDGRLLEAHRWPGNARELENEIQRALVLAEPGESLAPAHFSERIGRSLEAVEHVQAELRSGETLRETLARVETWLLRRALEANQNQRARTARQLGITREGLYKKMPALTGIARTLRNRGLAGLRFRSSHTRRLASRS